MIILIPVVLLFTCCLCLLVNLNDQKTNAELQSCSEQLHYEKRTRQVCLATLHGYVWVSHLVMTSHIPTALLSRITGR